MDELRDKIEQIILSEIKVDTTTNRLDNESVDAAVDRIMIEVVLAAPKLPQ